MVIHFAHDIVVEYGLEEGNAGERRESFVTNDIYAALGVDLIGGPVEHHHFAVEVIESAEAEVAVKLDFCKGDVFLIDPFDKGVDWCTDVDRFHVFKHSLLRVA